MSPSKALIAILIALYVSNANELQDERRLGFVANGPGEDSNAMSIESRAIETNNNGPGEDSNAMSIMPPAIETNDDGIDEEAIIDEIEKDLALTSNNSGFMSTVYGNIFVGGILLVAVFIIGILIGSSKCKNTFKSIHKYNIINESSSVSEYTTDDTIADEITKVDIQ